MNRRNFITAVAGAALAPMIPAAASSIVPAVHKLKTLAAYTEAELTAARTDAYREFVDAMLRATAAQLGVPYERLTADYRCATYSEAMVIGYYEKSADA